MNAHTPLQPHELLVALDALETARWQGALALEQDGIRHSIRLTDGLVTSVTTDQAGAFTGFLDQIGLFTTEKLASYKAMAASAQVSVDTLLLRRRKIGEASMTFLQADFSAHLLAHCFHGSRQATLTWSNNPRDRQDGPVLDPVDAFLRGVAQQRGEASLGDTLRDRHTLPVQRAPNFFRLYARYRAHFGVSRTAAATGNAIAPETLMRSFGDTENVEAQLYAMHATGMILFQGDKPVALSMIDRLHETGRCVATSLNATSRSHGGGGSLTASLEALLHQRSQALGKLSCYQRLGVHPTDQFSTLRAAYQRRQYIHADARYGTENLSDAGRTSLIEIRAALHEAYLTLTDLARRLDYDQAQGISTPSPQMLKARFEAEGVFKAAQLRMRDDEHTAAIDLLRKARMLNENEPEYQAYLAWAICCSGLLMKEDETAPEDPAMLLSRAIEADGGLESAWLFRGRIELSLKSQDAAIRSFRRVLEANPSNVEARDALSRTDSPPPEKDPGDVDLDLLDRVLHMGRATLVRQDAAQGT